MAREERRGPESKRLTLTSQQKQLCQEQLTAERERIRNSIARHERPAREGFTPHPDELDAAADEAERAVLLQVLDQERQLLAEVNYALDKFTDDSYGICEGTGEPIEVKRLLARPWARHSIAFKETLEREGRRRRSP